MKDIFIVKNNEEEYEIEGETFEGELFTWFETGLEGVVWSLQEFGKDGYDGLVPIKTGDMLTIFDGEEKVWSGIITPDITKNEAAGFRCHWVQHGVEPLEWAKMFNKLKTRDYSLTGVLLRANNIDDILNIYKEN